MEHKILIPEQTFSRPSDYINKNPAYIFHHLMKCGGTSLSHLLSKWFGMIYDHITGPEDLEVYKNSPYDLANLSSDQCLTGHFAYEGTYLHQRYPEVISRSTNYRSIIFVRDPLSFFLSLYYYSKKNGRMDKSLKDFYKDNQNLIAYFIPCEENNYREVLDSYFFIGVVERMNYSVLKLSQLINKRYFPPPFLNKSEKDQQYSLITPSFKKEFIKKNELDYKIYNYCLDKLTGM
ncbi:MAG: hypothetical protein ABI528_03225 [bacterium]